MRFISLLALFACFAMPAHAQYTTNSKTTAPAAKAQPAAQQRSAYQARPAQTAQQARPAAARVRPQAAAAADEGDADMPSFEAFAKPAAAQQSRPAAAQGSAAPAQRVNPYAVRRQPQTAPAAQGSAQGSHQIVWPKGEIWVYLSDFTWGDIDGAFVHCEWKAVLQNRTDTTISSLKISYVVKESYSELTFNNIKPRGADVRGMMFYSDSCPAMQGAKPQVKVLSCRMGDISGSDCSKYVVVK